MSFNFTNWLDTVLTNTFNISPNNVFIFRTVILFIVLNVFCLFIMWFGKKLLNYLIPKITSKTKTLWDDIILNKKVTNAVSHLVPAIIFNFYTPLIFSDFQFIVPFLVGLTNIFIVIPILYVLKPVVWSSPFRS